MTFSNIEKFNELTGRILANLYENFPVPVGLLPGGFIEGGDDAVLDLKSFTGAELTEEADFFMHTVGWLAGQRGLSILPMAARLLFR